MPKVIAPETEVLNVQSVCLAIQNSVSLSQNCYTCERNWWQRTVKLCLIVDREICKCTYLIPEWNYDESQLREKLLCAW